MIVLEVMCVIKFMFINKEGKFDKNNKFLS